MDGTINQRNIACQLKVQNKSINSAKVRSKLSVDMAARTLGEIIRQGLIELGISQSELARRVQVSPTYIGNLMRDASPSAKSGKAQPKLRIVDRIATQLQVPVAQARLAAGYAPPQSEQTTGPLDFEIEKLSLYYRDIPRECQLDVLALTEALWKRRRHQLRPQSARVKKTKTG